MGHVTREQIDRAKQIDILDYLRRYEPNNIRRVGKAYYLIDHDSFRISNGLWKWESQGVGGKNVIDYLIKVRGYSFVEAVQHLTGDVAVYATSAPSVAVPVKPSFVLPARNKDNDRAIAYLQKRGIALPLILECIRQGSIYESAPWHNCVFVGRDENGKARYATMRGTIGDFKRDADGSDKRFGFLLPPVIKPHSSTVAVFESPADVLSHQMLSPRFRGWRLSLGGTSLSALTHFLERHSETKSVIICTDNDVAGDRVAKKIRELPGITAIRMKPPYKQKDWNDALLARNEETIMEDKRKTIRFITSDYKTLFTVKDGDSVKLTLGYDGEVKTLKCRYIDDAHIRLVGEYTNDYHICQLAEISERTGNKYEEIPNQKPMLNILAAKYGEQLKEVEIPMTDAAIKSLVGGKYEVEPQYVDGQGINGRYGLYAHDAIARGKNGIAVLGVEDDKLTSLHPYWAQKYKRELGTITPHSKPSIDRQLETAKAVVDTQKSHNTEIRRRTQEGAVI